MHCWLDGDFGSKNRSRNEAHQYTAKSGISPDIGAEIAEYTDIAGVCRRVKLSEIAEYGHVLTPGGYVGAEAVKDDDETVADKVQKLSVQLGEQMAKGAG